MQKILVTGGAGFIGSNFVELAAGSGHDVVVLDIFTYAGHEENLAHIGGKGRVEVVRGNIADSALTERLLSRHEIDWVVNFAAESHVDRSIEGPAAFIDTNVLGVFSMLDASHRYYQGLTGAKREGFRFLQVSTDEVFGSLGDTGKFSETTPYAPNSPYSASKASGDHLVRAWFHTYKLPVLTTNCSNNYGPKQFPEKLIPHMINCALQGKPLPVYGNGRNVRDWIHVRDHCRGVWLALEKGQPGETYCFGGNSERANLDVVRAICRELDSLRPRAGGESYADLISFVEDRKGHDWRYAIDDSKAVRELGFTRQFKEFENGLRNTVTWYLDNRDWIDSVLRKNK